MKIKHSVTRFPVWCWAGLYFMLAFAGPSYAQEATLDDSLHRYFDWVRVAQLQSAADGAQHPGLAGAYAGVSNGVLLVAGGANFPETAPWQGGKKAWWDKIHVLEKNGERYEWASPGEQGLPKPMAYGASVATRAGLLCVGGENADGLVSDIVLLTWEPGAGAVSKTLGKLPDNFQVAGGALVGDALYVSGIRAERNALIRIGLDELYAAKGNAPAWREFAGMPGPLRQMPACAAQSDGQDPCFFLFGGRKVDEDGVEVLHDGYYYNTVEETWYHITSCPPVMAAAALPYGTNNILIFGGDNGELLLERDSLQRVIDRSQNPGELEHARQLLVASFERHPGFSRDIRVYNTITGTFEVFAEMPPPAPVTTTAVFWNNQVVLVSGEIRPGVRTPDILGSSVNPVKADFRLLDYAVLVLYFVILLLIGVYFSARQKSTNDYFIGGGRIPWWAAGLSVFGTALSAITFMAIPAKTFATDWTYFFYNISVLFTAPVIVALFIPFYRRLNMTTAYEYLEQRFNVAVRLFGSLSFILFQLGRIAIILYLPAIALSLVTGIDIFLCIVVVGVLSTAYTLIGGIEAVVWTDVVQVIILMGGAILSLVFMFVRIGDDFGVLATQAMDGGKLTIANMDLALNQPTIWVVVVGGFFVNLVSYSTDQSLVQRYLTTKDEKSAAKSVWTNAWLVLPATVIFFGIGTALFMYYVKFPARLDPLTTSNDSIFPWFITNELAPGISGLLIAGLFSAAMSSLSSSINSISTAFTTDFFRRFLRNTTPHLDLKVARIASLLSGVLGIALALWMATSEILSLWDKFFEVLGLFTGGLGGVFLLGMLFRQAHGRGAVVGLIVSSIVQYVVSQYADVHPFLYVATGLFTCVAAGYLASLLIPCSQVEEEKKRLTFHNL